MAELQDNKLISKLHSGFPDFLDWEQLRAEGLKHLGELSGKVWTDHNVHDPGITILEVLCYALVDLGYRTHLPIEEIFARDPKDTTKDNNFFTPAEILSCNPVTITDFRKLLVDIEGVRNAWLEDTFEHQNKFGPVPIEKRYNGVYKVYVELERDYDQKEPADKLALQALVEKIKRQLMAHRNLCEDFGEVVVLQKQKLGLCMEIELEADAVVDKVYREAVEALQHFFSPAPRFYSLKQLLEEKGKTMDAAFAGRPYNLSESHGFVDTDEFEQIPLRKVVHLSDVYHVLLEVGGVRNVSSLAWLPGCDKTRRNKGWHWDVPVNHVPDFSATCSEIRFVRKGLPVTFDAEQYAALYEFNTSQQGKVLYSLPSPYLDAAVPAALYRDDLADYQSIQHDFPRVYGIGLGGLPADAPDRRKAQALQLKGFLLFFDQLLANYVSQLSQIRSLFAFTPGEAGKRHTYYSNALGDVPDLDKLLRFHGGADGQAHGQEGDQLARPVIRQVLEDAIRNGSIKTRRSDAWLIPYSFADRGLCETAIRQLQQEILYGDQEPVVYAISESCWLFYLFPASGDLAIVSSRFYDSEQQAVRAAGSTRYAIAFRDNYRSFSCDHKGFTFSLELKLHTYHQYLQRITEDDQQYSRRRQDFLNHLLSRFAEQFTDFALLSFGFVDEQQLQQQDIQRKEQFLAAYAGLSSGRGKSYDYWLNGWNNDNLSGFEKRVIALGGLGESKRHYLSHFVVEPFEEYFMVRVQFGDDEVAFTSPEKFYARDEAEKAARALLAALAEAANYDIGDDPHTLSTVIRVRYDGTKQLTFQQPFATRAAALPVQHGLYKLFSFQADDSDVFVSKTVHRLELKDHTGALLATLNKDFDDRQQAEEHAGSKELEAAIGKADLWTMATGAAREFEQIHFHYTGVDKPAFTDLAAFKGDVDSNIVGRKGKFRYELLDADNNFSLKPVEVFDSREAAELGWRDLLVLLGDEAHYQPAYNEPLRKYELQIRTADKLIAKTEALYADQQEAEEAGRRILAIVQPHQYRLSVQEHDFRWSFHYLLGYRPEEQWTFTCTTSYNSRDEARAVAERFYAGAADIRLRSVKQDLVLELKIDKETIKCLYQAVENSAGDKGLREKMEALLRLKQEICQVRQNTEPGALSRFVTNDIADTKLKYVFRVTDKDHFHALYKGGYDRKEAADGRRNTLFQHPVAYQFTELLIAGDVILRERRDAGDIPWYHFLVKARGRGAKGDDLLLFESVQGYRSKTAALEAFDQQYLVIMHQAMQATNYGEGQYISLNELIQHEVDGCNNNKSVVFVPEETKERYNWYPHLIIEQLVGIALQYPVRYVTKEEDLFYRLFPCERDERIVRVEKGCGRSPGKAVRYYYYVLLDKELQEHWQSVQYYTTPDAAMQGFEFFLLLLRYPGNYTVQRNYCRCGDMADGRQEGCSCQWQVLIREVLAESKLRFEREEEAWQAIEPFICVVQEKETIQAYRRPDGCGYAFQVCGAGSLRCPAIDCHCEPYGMHLSSSDLPDQQPDTTNAANIGVSTTDDEKESACGEVIAFNPQYYATPKMVCEAIQRARGLVNCEGLHAVEHILLRPRCQQDEACEIPTDPGGDQLTQCMDISWKKENKRSGVRDVLEVDFQPWKDPYSFIVTVVLPAWPERFRKPANKLLIEQLLYREAPAHVMVRILWLKPKELDEFEGKFREWTTWGVKKLPGCEGDITLCGFRELLLIREYHCLEACRDHGDDTARSGDPCSSTKANDLCEGTTFQGNLNKLYAWPGMTCDKPKEEKDDKKDEVDKDDAGGKKDITAHPGPKADLLDAVVVTAMPPVTDMPNLPLASGPPPSARSKDAVKRFNARRSGFQQPLAALDNDPVYGRMVAAVRNELLTNENPTASTLSVLLRKIVKPVAADKHNQAAVQQLVQSSICLYLDRVCYEDPSVKRITTLEKDFKEMRKAGIDMEAVLTAWKVEEISTYIPDMPWPRVKKILTGKSK